MIAAKPYMGASPEAIQSHYDVSNRFYGLWLDPELVYSCALWEAGDDLAAAQRRKLDLLTGWARAAGVARVLDVGCGWGALMRRLVDHHRVEHVTGLTLSEAQAMAIRAAADPRIEVRVEGWADHTPTAAYDAIVSIGAFEHFADMSLGRAGRIESYGRFFDACQRWLVPGGRLALQTISKGGNTALNRAMVRDLVFINRHIFPESELPWPSEVLEASERRFELLRMRADGEHYARTCGVWLERLVARRDEAVEAVGEQRVADYERYLGASVRAFEARHIDLLRCVLVRI